MSEIEFLKPEALWIGIASVPVFFMLLRESKF